MIASLVTSLIVPDTAAPTVPVVLASKTAMVEAVVTACVGTLTVEPAGIVIAAPRVEVVANETGTVEVVDKTTVPDMPWAGTLIVDEVLDSVKVAALAAALLIVTSPTSIPLLAAKTTVEAVLNNTFMVEVAAHDTAAPRVEVVAKETGIVEV